MKEKGSSVAVIRTVTDHSICSKLHSLTEASEANITLIYVDFTLFSYATINLCVFNILKFCNTKTLKPLTKMQESVSF